MPNIRQAVAILTLLGCALNSSAGPKPNVIVVLVDDVGYGDFSCNGSPAVKTPRIDVLHDQSIRLTDFHVSPMCTPTRSQLMSGRDALDNGAMNVSSGRSMLRRGIPTMADVFAASGYRTAMFGKWHLGDVEPYRPQDRGFQKAIWFPSSHMSSAPDEWNNDYFNPTLRLEDGSKKKFAGYCTDIYFNEAMRWMREQAETQKPFFVYLPLNAAHAPLFVPDKYREPYRKLEPNLASFYAMIANIDENMGRLEDMLQESGLRDDTILIFLTDNGGTYGVKTFNAGMKGGKVTLWEGGHRVPCFMRWPSAMRNSSRANEAHRKGKASAEPSSRDQQHGSAGASPSPSIGSPRNVGELAEVQDLLPALIDLCELKPAPDAKFDGISLAPLLRGKEEHLPDRMLVVQFSRMNKPVPEKFDSTVIWNQWRLTSGKELYDIRADLKQDHNIAADHPDIVQKMREHYEKWWADIEPRVNQLSDIPIGKTSEPTLLSVADWQNRIMDQQKEVRAGPNRNAAWGIEVTMEGDYSFELRRWPREADAAIDAGVPPIKFVDGEYPAGKALPIAKARLVVGEQAFTSDVKADDKSVQFTVPLKPGKLHAQTWFYDSSGGELCGAYYVYVTRK
jgi:arylsulfatase